MPAAALYLCLCVHVFLCVSMSVECVGQILGPKSFWCAGIRLRDSLGGPGGRTRSTWAPQSGAMALSRTNFQCPIRLLPNIQ